MKKIKFFMTMLVTLSVGVISVSAEEYSKNYQTLTKDGTLTIADSGIFYSNKELLNDTLGKIKLDDTNLYFGISECNEDYTKCKIGLWDKTANNSGEIHDVTIKYEETYSDFFKKIAPEGNVVVPFTSTALSNLDLANEYVYSLTTKEYSASLHCENNSIDDCSISVFKITIQNENETHHTIYEKHDVKISFKESFSKDFQKVTTDGNLNISSIKPTTQEEADALLTVALEKYNTDSHSYMVSDCNETFTTCTVGKLGNYGMGGSEYHKVNMKYEI